MFPTKILLATDGSMEAGRAARLAINLSDSLGSELRWCSRACAELPSRFGAALSNHELWP